MMKLLKRMFAFVLAVTLISGSVPANTLSVRAAEVELPYTGTVDDDLTGGYMLTIKADEMEAAGMEYTAENLVAIFDWHAADGMVFSYVMVYCPKETTEIASEVWNATLQVVKENTYLGFKVEDSDKKMEYLWETFQPNATSEDIDISFAGTIGEAGKGLGFTFGNVNLPGNFTNFTWIVSQESEYAESFQEAYGTGTMHYFVTAEGENVKEPTVYSSFGDTFSEFTYEIEKIGSLSANQDYLAYSKSYSGNAYGNTLDIMVSELQGEGDVNAQLIEALQANTPNTFSNIIIDYGWSESNDITINGMVINEAAKLFKTPEAGETNLLSLKINSNTQYFIKNPTGGEEETDATLKYNITVSDGNAYVNASMPSYNSTQVTAQQMFDVDSELGAQIKEIFGEEGMELDIVDSDSTGLYFLDPFAVGLGVYDVNRLDGNTTYQFTEEDYSGGVAYTGVVGDYGDTTCLYIYYNEMQDAGIKFSTKGLSAILDARAKEEERFGIVRIICPENTTKIAAEVWNKTLLLLTGDNVRAEYVVKADNGDVEYEWSLDNPTETENDVMFLFDGTIKEAGEGVDISFGNTNYPCDYSSFFWSVSTGTEVHVDFTNAFAEGNEWVLTTVSGNDVEWPGLYWAQTSQGEELIAEALQICNPDEYTENGVYNVNRKKYTGEVYEKQLQIYVNQLEGEGTVTEKLVDTLKANEPGAFNRVDIFFNTADPNDFSVNGAVVNEAVKLFGTPTEDTPNYLGLRSGGVTVYLKNPTGDEQESDFNHKYQVTVSDGNAYVQADVPSYNADEVTAQETFSVNTEIGAALQKIFGEEDRIDLYLKGSNCKGVYFPDPYRVGLGVFEADKLNANETYQFTTEKQPILPEYIGTEFMHWGMIALLIDAEAMKEAGMEFTEENLLAILNTRAGMSDEKYPYIRLICPDKSVTIPVSVWNAMRSLTGGHGDIITPDAETGTEYVWTIANMVSTTEEIKLSANAKINGADEGLEFTFEQTVFPSDNIYFNWKIPADSKAYDEVAAAYGDKLDSYIISLDDDDFVWPEILHFNYNSEDEEGNALFEMGPLFELTAGETYRVGTKEHTGMVQGDTLYISVDALIGPGTKTEKIVNALKTHRPNSVHTIEIEYWNDELNDLTVNGEIINEAVKLFATPKVGETNKLKFIITEGVTYCLENPTGNEEETDFDLKYQTTVADGNAYVKADVPTFNAARISAERVYWFDSEEGQQIIDVFGHETKNLGLKDTDFTGFYDNSSMLSLGVYDVDKLDSETTYQFTEKVNTMDWSKVSFYRTLTESGNRINIDTDSKKGEKGTLVIVQNSKNAYTLKVTNMDTKVAKLSKQSIEIKGDYHYTKIPYEVLQHGRVYVKLTANDAEKSENLIGWMAQDSAPTVRFSDIAINNKKEHVTAVATIEMKKGTCLLDESLTYTLSGKADASFDVKYAGIEDNTAMINVTLLDRNVKGKKKINVTVPVYDKKTKEKLDDYIIPITVNVTSTVPKVTVKQTNKVNLFYTDAEQDGKLTITVADGTKINSAVLVPSSATSECDYTIEETTEAENVYVVKKLTDKTGSKKKGKIQVTLEGYVNPVNVNFTVKTENKAPKITQSAKSDVLYPNFYTYNMAAFLTLMDGNTNAPLDDTMEAWVKVGKDYVKIVPGKNITTAKNTYVISNYRNRLDFHVKDPATAKNATEKFTIQIKEVNWSKPVTVKYTLKVDVTKPAITLSSKTIKLNSHDALYKSQEGRIKAVMKGTGNAFDTSQYGFRIAGVDEKAIKAMEDNLMIAYDYGNIEVSFVNNDLADGTYKYVLEFRGQNMEPISAQFSVVLKAVEPEKCITVSKKGSIDVLDRENTAVTFTPKTKNVNGTLLGVGLDGPAKDMFVISNENGKLVMRLKSNVECLTKTAYEVYPVFQYESLSGKPFTLTGKKQTIKLKQGSPKVTVKSVGVNTLYRDRNNELTLLFDATLKKQDINIEKVELANYTGDLYIKEMLVNPDTKDVEAITISQHNIKQIVAANKKWNVKFNVYYKDRAGNEKVKQVTYKIVIK